LNEPGQPIDADTKAFHDRIDSEIRDGLKNEQDRRTECLRSMEYYNLRGANMIMRRDAESDSDFMSRPKRSLPFCHRVIRVLTSKTYMPGPARSIAGSDAVTKWLQGVYEDNLINSLWQRADRMATLNGMAAFQIAATGDPLKPIKVQLWAGWHEVIPYEMPGRANEVAAVVTIDAVDNQTRYTFWTEGFYRVYETDKLGPFQTEGGRTAKLIGEYANPYGIIPFAFVWYELPTSGLDSVHGLGAFLSEINSTIDEEMSDMAQAVKAYHTPQGIAYDADVNWQPVKKSGGFVRVNSMTSDISRNPAPKLEYLQAQLDINGGWANIRGVIDSELEALGVPLASYRMNSATLHSGAALMAEQMPLVDYAMERREPIRKYEDDLKTVVLLVAGGYYGRAELVQAAKLPISLTWSPATLDLPGQERDLVDTNSVAGGYESPIMIVQRRFGLSREQAIKHMQQVSDDHEELQKIMGWLVTPPAAPANPSDANKPASVTKANQPLPAEGKEQATSAVGDSGGDGGNGTGGY
jgi:hypothetical protein